MTNNDDELLKRLDVSHLETFEQDDTECVCMDSILETYHWAAARIRELEQQIAKLRQALKPFADQVYNDNGDMTVEGSYPKYEDIINAYFAYRATQEKD